MVVVDQPALNSDPCGEHDSAEIRVDGAEEIFKIDYYELEMDSMSPDPSDAAANGGLMTFLIPEGY
ncbi:DUF3768 domain-containing protein [Phenylobacterium sp.]|uniref:DUF3768 domain-containing protein n=1 Tax=Phenylobacterium sp. TaxID=1871053 RepID=UPI0034562DA1